MPYIPYLSYIGKYSIPIIVIIHTIQTIHTVISNIPYPTDLHTIPTIHTIPTTHAMHTIPTIHTKHTILSKHTIPDRPYTPYIPNIPYHTPTTPQGGRGTAPHPHHTTGGEGDSATPPPHHRGGGGWDPSHGGGGRAWCIYTYVCYMDPPFNGHGPTLRTSWWRIQAEHSKCLKAMLEMCCCFHQPGTTRFSPSAERVSGLNRMTCESVWKLWAF